MIDGSLYTPSKWGEEFHSNTCKELLGAGAAGPGKSLVLLMDPVQQIAVEHERCANAEDHPYPLEFGQSVGWALHLRRTRPMLEQTIARSKRIFPQIDPGANWHETSTTWTFSSGYKLQFGHCKDRDSWIGYMSNEYSWIGFDELVQFEKEQYDQISGRLRTADPVLLHMLRTRACTNPVSMRSDNDNITISDPQWVRKYFVEPAPEGRKVLRKKLVRRDGEVVYWDRMYLPATLYDNPDPQFVRDYEATLLSKPTHIRQALLYGDWWVSAGSFYGEAWNRSLHVCKPFKIPDSWPRFRSMDWGFKAPGCILWWAMDDDGNLYCEREYTFQGKTDVEVAARVKEIEKADGLWKGGRSVLTGPADDQLWEQRGSSTMSKADVFAHSGVFWVKADKKSRRSNAQLLLKRMQDHHRGTTTPGVVFFENCVQTIKTLPGIQTAVNDPECPADGGEDHWHDAVLYAVAYASRGREGLVGVSRDDDDDIEQEPVRSFGRDGYGGTI